jgi:type IV pilus assembly protein PilW
MSCRRLHTALSCRVQRGLTLIELMVAMALGLALTAVMLTTLVYSRSSQQRQEQLGSLQQNVRVMFDYLSTDTRMAGHLGCFTGKDTLAGGDFANTIVTGPAIANNYGIGIEGYDFSSAGTALTLASLNPNDSASAGSWRTNIATGGVNTLPMAAISSGGLTPGSDVLVIRTVSGAPVRLAANAPGLTSALQVENLPQGTCRVGGAATVSGFCPNSHGVVASCVAATVFQVGSIAGPTLNLTAPLGTQAYAAGTSEVFALQTIVYYVKRGANGDSPSLYRRLFDGTDAAGIEQELVEDVETMQLRYGVDTTLPEPDGVVDVYQTSQQVTNWRNVVAVRMGLLLRADQRVESDVAVSNAPRVNGIDVTVPTTGPRFDRRVFTTTVAVRNRISSGLSTP